MSAWLNHNLTAFDIGKMITLSLHLIDHSRSHLIKPKRQIRRLNCWTLLMQMWYARYEYQSNPKRGKKAACFGVIWFANSSQENVSHYTVKYEVQLIHLHDLSVKVGHGIYWDLPFRCNILSPIIYTVIVQPQQLLRIEWDNWSYRPVSK